MLLMIQKTTNIERSIIIGGLNLLIITLLVITLLYKNE